MSKKISKTAAKSPKSAKANAEVQVSVPITEAAPLEAQSAEAKPSRQTKEARVTKISALDAAYHVLAAKGEAMTAPELIEAMAEQKLWSSPKGKTPAATLYAAMLREITTKGKKSRFARPGRGKFAATAVKGEA
jgi:hypothetical protein